MPDAGDPAPDLTLPDDSGTIHTLADRRGEWTVVYFYPRDDSPGCTTEACSFRDANEALQSRGAAVWGISPQDAASKRAFREKHGLPFSLLVDADHAAAEAWGTWVEKHKDGKTSWGNARATFLVGPDLRIARAWPGVTSEGHADEVLEALAEAQVAPAQ